MTDATPQAPEQNTVQKAVPLSHTLGMGQRDKSRFSGTATGATLGQTPLKVLAYKVLQRDKAWDNTGTDARKARDKVPCEQAVLSHAKPVAAPPDSTSTKRRRKRCFSCDHWQIIKGGCWWAGTCEQTGAKVFFRTTCTQEANT